MITKKELKEWDLKAASLFAVYDVDIRVLLSEVRKLTEENAQLEIYKIDYQAVRSLCGLSKSDDSVANFIDNLYGRAESAEAACSDFIQRAKKR